MEQLCPKCGVPPLNLPPSSADLHSSVTRLLKSNDPPLDSQIPLIRNFISNEQNRVVTLDAQIECLQSTLARLTHQRDEAVERVHQHCAIISPVRQIPPELLCEIFISTLSDGSANADDEIRTESPWYLGHVCRSWRNAALSLPALWSCIAVPCSMSAEDSDLLSKMETQLDRSRDTALDIHLLDVRTNVNPRVVKPVLSHCSRWRSLTFHLEGNMRCSPHWLRPVKGRLDRLETFRTEGRKEGRNYRRGPVKKQPAVNAGNAVTIPNIFSTAANLRKVILSNSGFGHASPTVVIPWAQITHYRGRYMLDQQLEILSSAPNLLDCAIGLTITFGEFARADQIILPRLRRLRMRPPNSLLANLTAPLVEEVTVVLVVGGSLAPLLLPFIHRSLCTITKLVVRGPITSPDLVTALKGLPMLSYLLLENEDSLARVENLEHVPLFNAMAPVDICPNLTTFVYGFCYRAAASPYFESYLNMVQSRFRSNLNYPSHLGYARIFYAGHGDYSLPSSTKSQIEMLRDQGLDIVFLDAQETTSLRKTVY
ncbi:hypothetical protein B0H16DRAFT_1681964 [Mycena metata]|uniref:F-box domain-containing protein n=1 Tax=Mycena metata TaxID=1033252 RepID=A0AAD7KGC7_9AGAR|nr:hypothetical protein B0H16DRAFT_1681964 [Mycena metata]